MQRRSAPPCRQVWVFNCVTRAQPVIKLVLFILIPCDKLIRCQVESVRENEQQLSITGAFYIKQLVEIRRRADTSGRRNVRRAR